MSWDLVQTLIRSVLKAGAGSLIARGVMQSEEADELIGAIVLIASVVWGIYHRTGKPPGAPAAGALMLLCPLLLSGCVFGRYSTVRPDGSRTSFPFISFLSNSSIKGLVLDGNGEKRDAPGLRLTGATTEPNPDAITASGEALGKFTGAAAGTMVKTATH